MSTRISYRIPYFLNKSVNGRENVTVYGNTLSMHYGCPETTECSPYVLELPRGRFLLELWGAQGCKGGAGGYSKGILTLGQESPEFSTFYVYVGSSGLINGGNGGFNGGGALGSKIWLDGTQERRYVGGGSTDIRTIKGEIEKLKSINFYTTYFGPNESLESRIIVAGGGGGYNPSNGYGGGEEGPAYDYASAGNQESGGKTSDSGAVDAGFGYGGFTRSSGEGISGGGGGYYGGGGSTNAFGGSGFVNKTILKNAKTLSGNTKFPSPYSSIKELGHKSDGCARITYLDSLLLCTKRCSKSKGSFVFALIIVLSY